MISRSDVSMIWKSRAVLAPKDSEYFGGYPAMIPWFPSWSEEEGIGDSLHFFKPNQAREYMLNSLSENQTLLNTSKVSTKTENGGKFDWVTIEEFEGFS